LVELLAGSSQDGVVGSRLGFVDTKKEIRDFLTSRRARITPESSWAASADPAVSVPATNQRKD